MSHRFMYQNRLSPAATITPLSMAKGVVGGAVPRVANGSGGVIFTGPYTGDGQRVYTVEIDLAGDVGAATFKWRTTDTAPGAWEASGVLTALTDTALSDGVKARFTAGAGTDFSKGDRWEATASNLFGKRFLHDLDPNQRFRTGTPSDPESVEFALPAAQEVKAAILHPHNIPSGATTKVQGNSAYLVSMDGVDDYLAVPGIAGLGTYVGGAAFSVEGWAVLDSGNTNDHYLFGDANSGAGLASCSITFAGNNILNARVWNTSAIIALQSFNNPVMDALVYYCVRFDPADAIPLRLYMYNYSTSTLVEGTGANGTFSAGPNDIRAGTDFTFGRLGAFNGDYLGGKLGHQRIYTRALTTAQMTDHARGIYTDAAPLSRWRMSEGSGTTAADDLNAKTATLTGGAAWSSTPPLQGGAVWTSATPPLDETMAWRAGTMFRYLTSANKTWRYWRLLVSGGAGRARGGLQLELRPRRGGGRGAAPGDGERDAARRAAEPAALGPARLRAPGGRPGGLLPGDVPGGQGQGLRAEPAPLRPPGRGRRGGEPGALPARGLPGPHRRGAGRPRPGDRAFGERNMKGGVSTFNPPPHNTPPPHEGGRVASGCGWKNPRPPQGGGRAEGPMGGGIEVERA
ncbi:MAG: hypothetical protein HYU38_07220 [Candidatus Tectomicrobia bacterium]|nr:hypothetical protein [Candidatus Tectomicrobia bacterium]